MTKVQLETKMRMMQRDMEFMSDRNTSLTELVKSLRIQVHSLEDSTKGMGDNMCSLGQCIQAMTGLSGALKGDNHDNGQRQPPKPTT